MELNIAILLRLIFAHIISDFLLQSRRIIDGKRGNIENQKSKKYIYQLYHSLIHAVLSYVVVAQWDNWYLPLIIFISHFMIDFVKSNSKKENLSSFIIDQIAHVLVIVCIWLFMFEQCTPILDWFGKKVTSNQLWVIMIAYLFVLKPTSIMLGLFFKQWDFKDNSESLQNAGKWIGYMERILILTFILNNKIEAIGFLLAAKSIFRFGELRNANERKVTEYVLVGTLASFSIAIIIGVIVKLL